MIIFYQNPRLQTVESSRRLNIGISSVQIMRRYFTMFTSPKIKEIANIIFSEKSVYADFLFLHKTYSLSHQNITVYYVDFYSLPCNNNYTNLFSMKGL